MSLNKEQLAKQFHDLYEKYAPEYGYNTREDTKEFNPESPNGKLMIQVCSEIITEHYNELEGFIDSEEMQFDDGIHYEKDIDITKVPPELIAEMKGVRKGFEACKLLLKEYLAKNK